MSRKVIDCRDVPGKQDCTLAISGEEEEVIRAGVEHAVSSHGEKDTPSLRKSIRDQLKEEVSLQSQQSTEKKVS